MRAGKTLAGAEVALGRVSSWFLVGEAEGAPGKCFNPGPNDRLSFLQASSPAAGQPCSPHAPAGDVWIT